MLARVVDRPLRLAVLRDDVCTAAANFDARLLDRDTTVTALREWTAIANAAQAAAALAMARLADCGPPPDSGAIDAADFVAKATGITAAKARDQIKTGTRLLTAELTRAHAVTGALSPEQTAAIADAVTVAPHAEGALLADAATSSLGTLREKCATAKAAHQDLAAIERTIHAKRSLRRYEDAEGAAHLHAVGTKRQMSIPDQALKRWTEEVFEAARNDGVREPYEAYAFDGLTLMAEQSISTPLNEKPKNTDPIRHLAILRLDLTAAVRGDIEDGETCEIAGLGPISVATAREMLGESVLKLVLTKGVDVANVTHLGRGPNAAQKIALLWQQPVCSREGCGNRARLQYDHRVDWAVTHHTRLDETDPLCHPDHDLKTLHGWALVEGSGVRPMVPPDDPRHPRFRAPP